MLLFRRLRSEHRSVVWFAAVLACIVTLGVQAQDGAGNDAASMKGHDAGEEGKVLYRDKDYDAALPYLQVAAEWGLKDAQARLGQIYFKGLGSTEKNMLRGLAWLGTAASKPSSSGYEDLYENALASVSDENMAAVESVVEAYTKRFGSGEASVTCRMVKPLGSNMSQLSCDYNDRYNYSGEPGASWAAHANMAF